MTNKTLTRQIMGAAAALGLTCGAAAASDAVLIENFDKTIQVSGDLIGFDGKSYTVLSAIGVITVAANTVTCQGANCPELVGEASKVEFVSLQELGEARIKLN